MYIINNKLLRTFIRPYRLGLFWPVRSVNGVFYSKKMNVFIDFNPIISIYVKMSFLVLAHNDRITRYGFED